MSDHEARAREIATEYETMCVSSDIGRPFGFAGLYLLIAEALRTVEIEALERAAQWQDISTAPKDGSKILAWDGDYVIVRADPNGGWSDDFQQYLCLDKWMPLPAPPAVKEGEG